LFSDGIQAQGGDIKTRPFRLSPSIGEKAVQQGLLVEVLVQSCGIGSISLGSSSPAGPTSEASRDGRFCRSMTVAQRARRRLRVKGARHRGRHDIKRKPALAYSAALQPRREQGSLAPVKTSLDHLPDAKRRELARIVEILFAEFEDALKGRNAPPARPGGSSRSSSSAATRGATGSTIPRGATSPTTTS